MVIRPLSPGCASKTRRHCCPLDKPKQTFAVDGGCADWLQPNAAAAGYYRFTMADADFTALGKHLAALNAGEQMTYADAVSSGFRRGEVSPATLLSATPALAASDMPQVATALLKDPQWMREHRATEATRPPLDAYAIALYGPRLRKLGMQRRSGEAAASTNLRVRLAEFLAISVRDPSVRKTLNSEGRKILGLDGSGKVDLKNDESDLLQTTLMVNLQESGNPVFEAILVNSATITKPRSATNCWRRSAQAARRNSANARSTTCLPRPCNGRNGAVVSRQYRGAGNRAAFWTWFQGHYEAPKARMSPLGRGYLPAVPATGRCSSVQADELRNFFKPRIKDLIGGERILAQSLEGISQCNSSLTRA